MGRLDRKGNPGSGLGLAWYRKVGWLGGRLLVMDGCY